MVTKMMIEEHEKRSKKMFGQEFTEVHLWLDEFCLQTINHRPYRHNKRGVEFVKQKWGEKAADAARQHIIDDNFLNPENGDLWK